MPSCGICSFASRSYSAGEEIFREKPLLHVPFHWPFTPKQLSHTQAVLSALSPHDQAVFHNSANAYPASTHSAVAGIFHTNSFEMPGARPGSGECCGIFPQIARLNHSCEPNTRQEYDPASGEEVLYAARAIELGEELFDSYCDLEKGVQERRRHLKKYYKLCVPTLTHAGLKR